jgi:hypothetical protein
MITRANFEIAELSIDEMEAVSAGSTISPTNSTIALPHVRPQDLLTSQQVEKLLSITFNPPVPHG